MAPRATFKGFLRLSLISVPVKAFTSTNSGGDIRLNQLHEECNSRVKYQKVCPTHGVLASDEIVMGYEQSKGSYVVIDPDELSEIRKAKKENDKCIEIDGFVPKDELDPMYFSGRTYFLLPDGPVGQKPYQLLRQSMLDNGLYAIARAILSAREQLVVVRPIDELLGISVLTYASKLNSTSSFDEELVTSKFSKEELNLTQTLIDASLIKDFDMSSYKDGYTDTLTTLIDKKISGEEIVAAPDPEEPKVINLMDALKASVESARTGGVKKPASSSSTAKKTAAKRSARSKKKVASKMAPSAKKSAARKKKSG